MKPDIAAKPKLPFSHIPDWVKLHEVGLAIEKAEGRLPSVRRDSAEWQAWRSWMHVHGMTTGWSDRQPPDRMLTVTTPYPPIDVDALHAQWVRGKGQHLKLAHKAAAE